MTYEVDGLTIDAGETCISVTRKDGSFIDKNQFQSLFETAVALNKRISLLANTLASTYKVSVNGDTDTNIITVSCKTADAAAIQAIVTKQFPFQNIVVAS